MTPWRERPRQGFTLIEVVVAMGIAGILLTVAGIALAPQIRGWQMRTTASEVYEDLQRAQQRARQVGSYELVEGQLVEKKVFVSFDIAKGIYEARQWEDKNNDGTPQTKEVETVLFSSSLSNGVSFGWGPGVTREVESNCQNALSAPDKAVSFETSANTPPCGNRPCIRFNKFGFSEEGSGEIYLNKGALTYAIAGTRPGNFRLCRWNGSSWQ